MQTEMEMERRLILAFGTNDLKAWINLCEKLFIEAWLNECGTITATAESLNISRRGLHKLINKHHITFKNGGVR